MDVFHPKAQQFRASFYLRPSVSIGNACGPHCEVDKDPVFGTVEELVMGKEEEEEDVSEPSPLSSKACVASIDAMLLVAKATLRTTNAMCGVHALAMVAAEEEGSLQLPCDADPWKTLSDAVVSAVELEGALDSAFIWLCNLQGRGGSAKVGAIHDVTARDPKCLYQLSLVALHLQLYSFACLLLRAALVECEWEYKAFQMRPSMLDATQWLCWKLHKYVCGLVPYAEEERAIRSERLRLALGRIRIEDGGWVAEEIIPRCSQCADGGCIDSCSVDALAAAKSQGRSIAAVPPRLTGQKHRCLV